MPEYRAATSLRPVANRCRPYTDRCSTTHITTLDDHEHDERRRHAEQAAGRQPLQRLEARRVTEPLRLVVGDEPREAAIEQQPAQRDDERLQPQARDQQAVERAEQRAEREDDQHRQPARRGATRSA